jgi:hypothetical protein
MGATARRVQYLSQVRAPTPVLTDSYGKTPIQAFLDSVPLVKERMLAA